MKTIAFDQATIHTGWSIFEGSSLKKQGLIDASNASCRLTGMAMLVCRKIDETAPDLVVIEDTAYQSNASVYKVLCQLQGTIIGHCVEHGIPYLILAPTAWRKKLGFEQGNLKRPELKRLAVDYVENIYGIRVSDDVAEAVCIGAAATQKE